MSRFIIDCEKDNTFAITLIPGEKIEHRHQHEFSFVAFDGERDPHGEFEI